MRKLRPRHVGAALAALLVVIAAGFVLLIPFDPPREIAPPPEGAAVAAPEATPAREPEARGAFDVYLDGRTLTWVREPCAAEDVELRFFANFYPADADDLEGEYGYNAVDFAFADRGTRSGDRCLAAIEAPSYPIDRIVAGQYGGDGAWAEGFPLDPEAWLADWDAATAGEPAMRGAFDVYLDLDGGALTFVREPCAAEDVELRFFANFYPADASDLEGERGRERGYNGVGFALADHGLRYGGKCMAAIEAPSYPLARVTAGQYGEGDGAWREDYPLDPEAWLAAWDAATAGEPTMRGAFDVYLDLEGGALTFAREPCAAEDVALRFFANFYPADAGDLEGERPYNGIGFALADHGLRYGGRCMAAIEAPDYPLARVTAGQYGEGDGAWREDYPLDPEAWLAAWDAATAGEPTMRGAFDVYLDRDGGALTFAREPCAAEDVAFRFFANFYPADAGDLEGERAYNRVDFALADHGLRYGGKCMAAIEAPSYRLARFTAGQYGDGDGAWSEDYPLDPEAWLAAWDAATAGEPTMRGAFDVYLDLESGALTFAREPCAAEDVALRFFANFYPADAGDLEGERPYNGVGFALTDHGLRYGGRCMTTIEAPDYPLARVTAGQYGEGDGAWREDYPLDPEAWLAAYGAATAGEPTMRGAFDVYLDLDGGALTFAREPCAAEDVAFRFFANFYPADAGDLEGERPYNGVGFALTDHGLRYGGKCMTTIEAPSYPLARVTAGQYGEGDGAWREDYPLDAEAWLAAWGAATAGEPVMRGAFDVYLDPGGRALTYAREPCTAEDAALRFFTRYYPADESDLEGERAYNGGSFALSDHGLRYGGRCMASFALPSYAIARIATGQYGDDGTVWEGELPGPEAP